MFPQVAAGESGLLSSCSRNSGFFSSGCWKFRVGWGVPQRLRAPFEVQQKISVPMDLQHGMQDSTGVLSQKLGLYLSLVGIQCSWRLAVGHPVEFS